MNRKIRVAIVEDQELFRSGIITLLNGHNKMEVAFDSSNGLEFLQKLKKDQPDVVLMDLSMPQMDGSEAAQKALALFPDLKIIVLSMLDQKDYYARMIKCGVKGYVNKDVNLSDLYDAIEEVAQGGLYFSQDILRQLVLDKERGSDENSYELTDNELSTLEMICKGYTNKEIADQMCLSIKTIEKYRNTLIKKTNSRNTAQLVMKAIKEELVLIEG
ncbi:response regulator [Carboxylicivirga marina]|uniref:response regulator n=1 Tax=Carboxylicivirga marina TaxID=2800988 RepID=UPI0025924BA6|nr:response regulator transcription factor [uncultured Carboxylicivirga sp.]